MPGDGATSLELLSTLLELLSTLADPGKESATAGFAASPSREEAEAKGDAATAPVLKCPFA